MKKKTIIWLAIFAAIVALSAFGARNQESGAPADGGEVVESEVTD